MNKSELDMLWVLVSAVLVLLMQGGFLCFESGMTRTKNAINVAMKNVIDLTLAVVLFWLVGFGLMFGVDYAGIVGWSGFLPDVGAGDPWLATFFVFQTMFCATAATIVAGAIAERTRFDAYIFITVLVTGFIYPVFGHWAWGGAHGGGAGWLATRGFVDFAGSTVVHSVGGWVALAAVIVVGPRRDRFIDGEPQTVPPSNLPLCMLGLLLFFVGWIGFNGGSTWHRREHDPRRYRWRHDRFDRTPRDRAENGSGDGADRGRTCGTRRDHRGLSCSRCDAGRIHRRDRCGNDDRLRSNPAGAADR